MRANEIKLAARVDNKAKRGEPVVKKGAPTAVGIANLEAGSKIREGRGEGSVISICQLDGEEINRATAASLRSPRREAAGRCGGDQPGPSCWRQPGGGSRFIYSP